MSSLDFADRVSLVKYSEFVEEMEESAVEDKSVAFDKSCSSSGASLREIVSALIPNREFLLNDKREDVISLQREFEDQLDQCHARSRPICPIRDSLYRECFDELIRQITIDCPERGLLLGRIRNEIYMTIAYYEAMYEQTVIDSGTGWVSNNPPE